MGYPGVRQVHGPAQALEFGQDQGRGTDQGENGGQSGKDGGGPERHPPPFPAMPPRRSGVLLGCASFRRRQDACTADHLLGEDRPVQTFGKDKHGRGDGQQGDKAGKHGRREEPEQADHG